MAKPKCFEGDCQFVVGKVMFEAVAHVLGGGVSDGFVEVDDLTGEVVESGALFVRFTEVVGGVRRGRNGEVVDVYGGVDELVVVEPLEQYSKK
jgi:hypothetical protein